MNEPVIYEVRDLHKQYGRKAALNGASFAVQAGRLVGLLGPNGSGKTTPVSYTHLDDHAVQDLVNR